MYVFPDDFVGRSLIRDRTYEPHVSAALRAHLSPGRVLVDLGAHAGYYSLMAAGLVGPSGRVLSFEPNPVSCSLLLRNVRANGFANVEVHPLAVAEARGILRIEGRGSHARIVDPDEWFGAPSSSAVAMAVTLDEALREVPRVDVIKMDIEGAEFRALQGARQTLARHRAVIFSELSPAGLQNVSGVSAKEYLEALAGAGYELSTIEVSGALLACGTDVGRVLDLLERSPSTHLDIVAHPR
jgi:FkbM family methyltransferase